MKATHKKSVISSACMTALMLTLGSAAQAQEVGKVISSQAVIQQVAVPRQVCTNQQVVVPGQKTGAGGIMGAIAGGAIGNNVGGGAGRTVATVIGVVGGAVLGDRIEGAPPSQVQTVQNCGTQTFYENRTVAYNVVYEFNGKQYQVQMPNNPGAFIQLQVTPIGGGVSPSSPTQIGGVSSSSSIQPAAANSVLVLPPEVITPAPPPVVYVQRPYAYTSRYYSPVIYPSVNLGLNWGGHYGSHRHWH